MAKKNITLASLTALGAAKASIATKQASADEAIAAIASSVATTPVVETTTETVASEPAEKVVSTKANDKELVKLRLPEGSREHGEKSSKTKGDQKWMITPMFKGRERWFDRTKIADWGSDDKGMFAIVTRKEAVQREMQQFIEGVIEQ
ncbi:hypothetical protein EVB27_066 [Rhizobium phage RHph_TM16]|nr:hypothetical protein EVB27_066 [Rhizobium phage RHph_TM16]